MTIPGVRSSFADDFYVLLVGWEPISTGGATFKVYLNPLINFVWLGGMIFILGTLVAAWPDAEVEIERVRQTKQVPAVVGAD
ncbi:MAG: cytochrome c-type biogenesis CcmF C-terminal domain-containing protein [Chloroflexota bacterium]